MEDLDDLVRNANNFNIARNLTDGFPHPYTIQNGRAFIENAIQSVPPRILCIEVEGRAAGGIGLHPQSDVFRKNAELGYWLAEPYWGKGIMTNAVKQMVEYSFSNFDINRIFARPFGSNIASQHVLEKAGFQVEARFHGTIIKNGKEEDEVVYAVRRKNRVKE